MAIVQYEKKQQLGVVAINLIDCFVSITPLYMCYLRVSTIYAMTSIFTKSFQSYLIGSHNIATFYAARYPIQFIHRSVKTDTQYINFIYPTNRADSGSFFYERS